MLTRQQICTNTATKLRAATPANCKALIGCDGFIDEIIAVVDKRKNVSDYDPILTIPAFGQKVLAAAGQSANFELVTTLRKAGGNGPLMTNGLVSLGFPTTYVGNLGKTSIDPVFHSLQAAAATHGGALISIADAAHTNALEFQDGKLMLGNLAPLVEMTWPFLVQSIGLERLIALAENAALIGLVNWTMIPAMTAIWTGFLNDVAPKLSLKKRYFFVDLCDPQKRLDSDLLAAMQVLTQLQHAGLHVVLGLNYSEAQQVYRVLGLTNAPADSGIGDQHKIVIDYAQQIRVALALGTVVIHPRHGAGAATATDSAYVAGPFVLQPKLSTGAGDHFNAGFSAGLALGFTLEESLTTGVGVSGYYVRNAAAPTLPQLADFVEHLPPPQD